MKAWDRFAVKYYESQGLSTENIQQITTPRKALNVRIMQALKIISWTRLCSQTSSCTGAKMLLQRPWSCYEP